MCELKPVSRNISKILQFSRDKSRSNGDKNYCLSKQVNIKNGQKSYWFSNFGWILIWKQVGMNKHWNFITSLKTLLCFFVCFFKKYFWIFTRFFFFVELAQIRWSYNDFSFFKGISFAECRVSKYWIFNSMLSFNPFHEE